MEGLGGFKQAWSYPLSYYIPSPFLILTIKYACTAAHNEIVI